MTSDPDFKVTTFFDIEYLSGVGYICANFGLPVLNLGHVRDRRQIASSVNALAY